MERHLVATKPDELISNLTHILKHGIPEDVFEKARKDHYAEGIPFGKGYVKPLYLLPYFQTGKLKHKYQKGICPVAERLHFEQLMNSAPMIFRYPMNKSDMNEINIAFKKILDNKEEFVL